MFLPIAAMLGITSIMLLSVKSETAPLIEVVGGKNLTEKMRSIWNAYGKYLKESAERLGIPVSTCAAILAIESSGNGFSKSGRMIIRYENHWFKKITGGKTVDFSHKNQDAEWAAFEKARAIDEDAAFRSISMGIAQVMGFNYKSLGYKSPKEMFIAMQSGIGPQIDAFFKFVENKKPCLKAARESDFASFAYNYNGSGYKKNKYDEKMANAKQAFINAMGFA